MIERIIGLIAPHQCVECSRQGELLCEPCRLSSLSPPPSRCYRCHSSTRQFSVCDKCHRSVSLSHLWVGAYYQENAKELLHKFKFERGKAASRPISLSINSVLPDLPKEVIVTNIPTSPRRVRVRGYDQSELIARKLSRQRGWKYKKLLLRKGNTRQVGSGRAERIRQAETAFLPIKNSLIKNSHLLIIDDVTTTGATLEAAAKILKSRGAKSIDAAVFAQAIDQ